MGILWHVFSININISIHNKFHVIIIEFTLHHVLLHRFDVLIILMYLNINNFLIIIYHAYNLNIISFTIKFILNYSADLTRSGKKPQCQRKNTTFGRELMGSFHTRSAMNEAKVKTIWVHAWHLEKRVFILLRKFWLTNLIAYLIGSL